MNPPERRLDETFRMLEAGHAQNVETAEHYQTRLLRQILLNQATLLRYVAAQPDVTWPSNTT